MNLDTSSTEAMRTRRAPVLFFGLAVAFALVLFLGLHPAGPAHAATPSFTVNSTNDPGTGGCNATECTLREAIRAANKRAGADTIKFKIPGTGVRTISPTSALPLITRRVTINGYTQPGSSPNANTQGAINASPLIELKWTSGTPRPAGLELEGAGASNSVIRGLVINEFDQGIKLDGGTGYKIQGNFIGTDPTGTVAKGNNSAGVTVLASDSTIEGTLPAARNLISGNGAVGIQASGVVGSKIQGNLIGTWKDGTGDPGTGDPGNGTGIIIRPNLFSPSKNNLIGGMASGAANTIAFNDSEGIKIDSGATGVVNIGARILSNSIFSNGSNNSSISGGLGINLSCADQVDTLHFVDRNDDKDTDTGPNNCQNYPVVTLAQSGAGFTNIGWTLDSTPSTRKKKSVFIIQFFSSPSEDPSHFGEGKTFLGQIQVNTNRQGHADSSKFPFSPAQVVPVNHFVTATATNKATGNTSEFSRARQVVPLDIGGAGP